MYEDNKEKQSSFKYKHGPINYIVYMFLFNNGFGFLLFLYLSSTKIHFTFHQLLF